MQSIFDKFKAWLKKVYQDIVKDLQGAYKAETGEDLPPLTGEIAKVMDRMIASDKQIKILESQRNLAPIFRTREMFEGTDEEWETYRQMDQEATQEGLRKLELDSLRQMKWLGNAKSKVLKAIQKNSRAARSRVQGEVQAELIEQPVYKTIRWLKRGIIQTGGDETAEVHKLSIPILKSIYADENAPDWQKLGKGKGGMLAREGLHPDQVAEMFGFTDGDSMIKELLAAPTFKEAVEAETDKRMLEEYSELSDPEEIAKSVDRAVNNSVRSRFIAAELRHLEKSQKPVRAMMAAAKRAAKLAMGQKKVSDLRPHRYNVAATQAGKASMDAMRKGDSKLAAQEKRRQLLNIQMAREATVARSKVDKSIEHYKKIFKSDVKLAKTRDMNFVSAARAILANYGLGRPDVSPGEYLEKIAAYDPELMLEIGPMVSAHTVKPQQFKDLAFNDFLDMHDQVDALWHLSRRSRQIEVDGKLVDQAEAVDELVAKIPFKEKKGYDKAVSSWEKKKIGLMGLKAALRRAESWVEAMDGGHTGPFRKYIWNRISEAVTQYRLKKTDVLDRYLKILSDKGSLVGRKIHSDELGYTFQDKAELLHAILHTGNDSNKGKLIVGRKWGTLNENKELDAQRWESFMARMYSDKVITKSDMDLVQSIWDLLEELKPEAQKAHRNMYGFYFNEITATPLQTPFGEYRGGYVPAVTDPSIVTDAVVNREKETQQADNSFMFPTTGRGFSKNRVDQYNEPLLLNLGSLAGHIDKVLRFVYVESAVKDVAKIVKSSRAFSEAMDAFDPAIRGDMLIPWLQRTAQQMASIPSTGRGGRAMDVAASMLRKRAGMNIMVANITNTIQQFTGLSISMARINPQYMRSALWQYMRHPSRVAEDVIARSDFMKTRMSNYQFEVLGNIEDILLDPSKYDELKKFADKHGYFMQSATQGIVDNITWIGAYNQFLETSSDEKEAIRFADSTVRETQGSFAPEDISRFESGSHFARAFTMFTSYFNMMGNLMTTDMGNSIRNEEGVGRLAYLYATIFMIPAVLSEIMVQGIGGFDTGDDDEFDLWDAMSLFFTSQGRTAAALVPVIGPTTMAIVNRTNSKQYDDRLSTSPIISQLESTFNAPFSAAKAVFGDGSWKRATRDIFTAIGMISGIPVGQIGKPAGYIADVAQGRAKPKSGLDVVRGVVGGKDVNRKQ
jgi:hypothetical protein